MPIAKLLGPALRLILLSALGLVVTVEVASGAVYRTRYDPLFGEPYPNLGFMGTADFEVDDACLAGEPNSGEWKPDGDCGEMTLLSATVELYNGDIGPGTILDTLTFESIIPDPILGVFVQFSSETGQNEVIGLDTTIFGPQDANVPGAYIGPLWLQFISGQMPSSDFTATLADISTSQLLTGIGGAFLYASANCPTEEETPSFLTYGYYPPPQPQECSGNPDEQSTLASNITFERLAVPEPGSLALIVGALGAGWFARRKIRKA